jgi:hypothetical protein
MNKDDIYFNPPDAHVREKPQWTKDVDQHIKDFFASGGKVTRLAHGESSYGKLAKGNPTAFVINPRKSREE